MWQNMFNSRNPFWVALGRVCMISIINVVMLVFCVPVITIGASLTAGANLLDNMALDREPERIIAEFFESFKINFKQATGAWLIMLAALAVLLGDLYFGLAYEGQLASFFRVFGVVGIVAWTGVSAWLFPIIARYENKMRAHFSNAVSMAITQLPRTILMALLILSPVIVCLFSVKALALLIPFMFLFGFAGLGYLCALLRKKVFEKYS